MTEASRILVVHGDKKTSESFKSALVTVSAPEFSDMAVEYAATLREAVALLEGCTPKMIFAALDLSDSAGLETLRALRAKCPDSPIITLVEDGDHAAGAVAVGNGAQDYLYLAESHGDVIERSMMRAMGRKNVEEQQTDSSWRSGIGETAMGIRHEINNPLAALMLNLEMLREGGHEDAEELLEGIEIAAKRIAAVVRRLEGLHTPQRVAAIGGEAMVDLSGKDSDSNSAERKEAAAASPQAGASGKTILLVDDEESVRAVVTKILSRHGHGVLEAEHGADALRLAAGYDGTIDLLITDMYMPGLRGPEILEKLRPSRPGIQVLFMSGYGDEDVARSGVVPGSSFLRKPFTVQELSEAVQQALSDPRKE